MRNRLLAGVGVAVSLAAYAWADEPQVDLEKIVVSAYRYEEQLNRTASDISVITPADIQNSNAGGVIDMLGQVTGVTTRDLYGNGVASTVDIGGFGEQAGLNVLVLIDGRRVNDVDLSGVDWKQIPLDQVERIEVIRGGSGGVLYGDNASSGVINIITKRGSGRPRVLLETAYGSYDMNKQKVSLMGSADDKFSYLFNAGREATHGYRKNTYDKSKDFTSKLGFDFTDTVSGHFDSGFHASSFGLPSGLFQHHIDEHGRRWARYGDDHVNNKDYHFVSGLRADFLGAGCLDLDVSYRRKDTDSFFLTSGNDTRKNKIETIGVTPKYTLKSGVFDRDNTLVSGLDFYRVFYRSNNYDLANDAILKNYTHTNKDSIGAYLQDEFSVFKQLILVGGYRYEFARYAFVYHDLTGFNPDRDSKLRPAMEAFNSGIVYNYSDDSSLFFNAGKSFRFPEVDEFIGMYDINFHQFLNTDLKPQSSLNYQVGLRHRFSDRLKASLSAFRMKVRDYIYFNPTGGTWGFGENENYEKTLHQGLEFSSQLKLNNRTTLSGNYAFTRAIFYGGQYDKNDIPMVPRHKGSVSLNFILPADFTVNLTGTYVGKKYFINDQANAVSRLNGYMVADMNISWSRRDTTVTLGVNNLFDKEYSEFGVFGSDSSNGFVFDKCYFPSPGRNYSFKLESKF